ncbi:MAG: hypothetical protein K2N91_03535, partial [Muribaculaceae bacterium]|nr:hypothetical protein [Muribaculaceae bacterium]
YYADGYDQVYSSKKAPEYAGELDADCMLWGLAEVDGSFYLYNAAAGKFAYIREANTATAGTGGHYDGNAWFFSGAKAAAIDIRENAANENINFPNVEVWGDANAMGISNSYRAPVITYYTSNDPGVPMQFEFVKEADQELVESMIQEYATPDMETIANELNRVHGSTTAYNTPGYVPVGVDYVDALVAAYAQKDSADPFTLTSAVKAALAAVPEDIADDRTADYSPEALYRIQNAAPTVGYLYYNAATPNYLFTTSKTAYTGEMTDDCMLWGLVDGYLYNAGAQRFAYLPTKSNNNYWVFGGFTNAALRPAVIDINASSTGYPDVNIQGDGVKMHVSIGYNCPIIVWNNPTTMRFEFVKTVDDEVLHTTVATLNSTLMSEGDIDTMKARFNANTAADPEWTIGHNQEGDFEMLRTALTEAREINDSPAAKFARFDNAWTAFRSGIELPEAGLVYTIESVHADHTQYIYNNDGTLAIALGVTGKREDLPATHKWYCQQAEDSTFTFTNYIDNPIPPVEAAPALYACRVNTSPSPR